MASERDNMNAKAQRYISAVRKAGISCAEARSQLAAAQAALSQSWQSDAGSALVDALEKVCARLERVNNDLITAGGMMSAEVLRINNNWLEED